MIPSMEIEDIIQEIDVILNHADVDNDELEVLAEDTKENISKMAGILEDNGE